VFSLHLCQGAGERNYHIFYQLCKAPEAFRAQYKLQAPQNYRIVVGGNCVDVNGIDDERVWKTRDTRHIAIVPTKGIFSQEFVEVTEALDCLNFSHEEKNQLFKTTAGVMHLGNVEFTSKKDKAHITNGTVV